MSGFSTDGNVYKSARRKYISRPVTFCSLFFRLFGRNTFLCSALSRKLFNTFRPQPCYSNASSLSSSSSHASGVDYQRLSTPCPSTNRVSCLRNNPTRTYHKVLTRKFYAFCPLNLDLLGYLQTFGSQEISFEDTMSPYNDRWPGIIVHDIRNVITASPGKEGQVLNALNIFTLSAFSPGFYCNSYRRFN